MIGARRRRYNEGGRGAIRIIKDSCVTHRNDPRNERHRPLPDDATRFQKAVYCTRRSHPVIMAASFFILFVIAVFEEEHPEYGHKEAGHAILWLMGMLVFQMIGWASW